MLHPFSSQTGWCDFDSKMTARISDDSQDLLKENKEGGFPRLAIRKKALDFLWTAEQTRSINRLICANADNRIAVSRTMSIIQPGASSNPSVLIMPAG